MDDLAELKALLRALPELIALADAGQITAAAAHLEVQQPTFSRTITRLSDALDVPVVRRSGRGVELTPQGRAMLPHARRALDEARRAIAAVHDRAADEDRTVAVAFQTALGQSLVPELLRKLTKQHPALRFELRQGSRQHCLELLAEGWATSHSSPRSRRRNRTSRRWCCASSRSSWWSPRSTASPNGRR